MNLRCVGGADREMRHAAGDRVRPQCAGSLGVGRGRRVLREAAHGAGVPVSTPVLLFRVVGVAFNRNQEANQQRERRTPGAALAASCVPTQRIRSGLAGRVHVRDRPQDGRRGYAWKHWSLTARRARRCVARPLADTIAGRQPSCSPHGIGRRRPAPGMNLTESGGTANNPRDEVELALDAPVGRPRGARAAGLSPPSLICTTRSMGMGSTASSVTRRTCPSSLPGSRRLRTRPSARLSFPFPYRASTG